MRVLGFVLGVALAGGALWLLLDARSETAPTAPAATAPAAPPALTPKQVHDCADECEQTALLGQWPDERLRACRAHCKGQEEKRPYQPIRRITVAPADHHR